MFDTKIPRLRCSGICGWRKYGTGQWAVKEIDVFEFECDGDDFYSAFRVVSYDKLNKRLGHMMDAEYLNWVIFYMRNILTGLYDRCGMFEFRV